MKVFSATAVLLGLATLSGCSGIGVSKSYTSIDTGWEFIIPQQDWLDQTTFQCKPGYTCWSSLTQKQIRRALTDDARIELSKVNSDGSLSAAGGNIQVSRGKYLLSEYIVKVTARPCDPSDPSKGNRLVGAGIQVIADIDVRKSSANISGLLPIAASASSDKVRGKLRIRSWGMDTDQTIVQLLNTSRAEALDDDGIKKAITALEVAEALLKDPKTEITPWTFALAEEYPGSCRGVSKPTPGA